MIIVPNLRWRTFRYWAVRATVACGVGWSPAGGKLGNFYTNFDLKNPTSKPTSILLQDASSPRQQAEQCIRLLMSSYCAIKKDKSKRVAYRHQQFKFSMDKLKTTVKDQQHLLLRLQ